MRIVLIMAAAALTAGCGGGGREEAPIVASPYPLEFAAAAVAGADRVAALTPPGAEPHDVELTARDVARLRDAELVLYVGGGFQPAVERALADAETPSLDALAAVDPLRAAAHGHEGEGERAGEDDLDPHFWLDPLRFAEVARALGARLDRPDEAGALARQLEALHEELAAGLADCERRTFVTSHAAFAYLADRYDLEQVAIAGLSPEAEPTPRDLEEIVEHVRESGATTVFFETLVSPRLAEAVARETGARTAVLNPIEGLTAEQAEAGADYVSLMRDNLAALREALGCR